MSLRRSVTAIVVIVAAFASGTALALIVLTDYLHRTASEVTDALHSIRLIQQLEIDLLVHARSLDSSLRSSIETAMLHDLQSAEQYVDSQTEQAALDRAMENAKAYFQRARAVDMPAAEQLPELNLAIDSMRELLDINTAEANRAEAQAARWNEFIGRAVPLITSVLVLAVTDRK